MVAMPGAGVPVLFVHGAFCGGWAWDGFRARFEAAGFDCHTPDLRHHGPSARRKAPAALGTTSLLDYLSDLLDIYDALPEPPVLVGHSMGGLLAQMIAARRAPRAAVLLAPSAPWGVLPSTNFELASAGGLFLAGQFWNTPIKPRFWIAAAHALDRMDEKTRSETFAQFVPESGLAMFEVLHWMWDVKRASTVYARDVECPVLCLAGTSDRVTPPRTVRRVAMRYSRRADYAEMRAMSHWLMGEPGWESVAEKTLDWLGRALEKTAAPSGRRGLQTAGS